MSLETPIKIRMLQGRVFSIISRIQRTGPLPVEEALACVAVSVCPSWVISVSSCDLRDYNGCAACPCGGGPGLQAHDAALIDSLLLDFRVVGIHPASVLDRLDQVFNFHHVWAVLHRRFFLLHRLMRTASRLEPIREALC